MSRTKLKDAISDSTDPSPDLMPATGQNFNRGISRITPLALTFSHILLLSKMSLYNYYSYCFIIDLCLPANGILGIHVI